MELKKLMELKDLLKKRQNTLENFNNIFHQPEERISEGKDRSSEII